MSNIPTPAEFEELCRESDQIDKGIQNGLNLKKILNHNFKGRWNYIPFHHENILYELFSRIVEKIPSSFKEPSILDVGCGTGRIVWLAKQFGIKAKGIEFYNPYVENGRKFFNLSEEELIVQDAFDLSEEFLWQFSVIYTYMPISNKEKMGELHLNLRNKTRYPTILAEMYPVYYPVSHLKLYTTWLFTKEEQDKFDVVIVRSD